MMRHVEMQEQYLPVRMQIRLDVAAVLRAYEVDL